MLACAFSPAWRVSKPFYRLVDDEGGSKQRKLRGCGWVLCGSCSCRSLPCSVWSRSPLPFSWSLLLLKGSSDARKH